MLLLEILKALYQAPCWKAKYVGELPPGVKEVVRETFECFSITFSSELDAEKMKDAVKYYEAASAKASSSKTGIAEKRTYMTSSAHLSKPASWSGRIPSG